MKKEVKMALAFAPKNKELIITKLQVNDKTRKHLRNLGLLEGSEIMSMLDNKCDVIVKVKDVKFAINKSLAMRIYVN